MFLLFLTGAYTEVIESRILVDVIIPESYKKVEAGNSLLAQVEIILLEKEYNHTVTDILIEYILKSNNETILTKISETKGIRERISTVKELIIPTDAEPGIYILEVKSQYLGEIGTDAVSFEVVKPDVLQTITKQQHLEVSVLILLAVTLLLSLWNFKKLISFEKDHRRIDERDLKDKYIPWKEK